MSIALQPIDPALEKFIVDSIQKAIEAAGAGDFDGSAFIVMVLLVLGSAGLIIVVMRKISEYLKQLQHNVEQSQETLIAMVQKTTEGLTANRIATEEFRRDILTMGARLEALENAVKDLKNDMQRCAFKDVGGTPQ